MGGTYSSPSGHTSAWCGGKPNATWTGLDNSAPKEHTKPGQIRSSHEGNEFKAHSARVTGLKTEIKKLCKISEMEHDILKHLTSHGLDTITYIQSPADPSTMVSVIEHSARINLEEGRAQSALNIAKYDKYDRANDEAAVDFLLDSMMDSTINTQFRC